MAAAVLIVLDGWQSTGDTEALADLLWDYTSLNRIEGRWVAEKLSRGDGPCIAKLETEEVEWFMNCAIEYGARNVHIMARAVNE